LERTDAGRRTPIDKVFLLLSVHKKKTSPSLQRFDLVDYFKMRRPVRILVSVAGVVVAIALVVWVGLLCAPSWLPAVVGKFSGGAVVMSGLSGRMPDRLRLAHFELRDEAGAWATADQVQLDWSPLALFAGRVSIADLAADQIAVLRRPVPRASTSSSSSSFFPRVEVHRIHVGRLDVARVLAGHEAVLTLDGDLRAESLAAARADLVVVREDQPGRYELHLVLDAAGPHLALELDEPARGLLANLAGLPALGVVHVAGNLDGPLTADRVSLQATAGALVAGAEGVVDLKARTAAHLDVTIKAPAMMPGPELAWRSIDLGAHLSGPLLAPDLSGHLRIVGLSAYGAGVGVLDSVISGSGGGVGLDATLAGLVVPGAAAKLFASAPIELHAALSPQRVASFALAHPLLNVTGQGSFGSKTSLNAHVTVPELAPFAAVERLALQGETAFDLSVETGGGVGKVRVDGTVGIASGPPNQATLGALVGEGAKFSVAGSRSGNDVTLSHLTFTGKTLTVSVSGTEIAGTLVLDWQAGLSDLRVANARLHGTLQAQGSLSGTRDGLAAIADVSADVGLDRQKPAALSMHLALNNLLTAPVGTVTAQGQFAGAPVALDAGVERASDGTLRADINQADWRSLHARGMATLPPGSRFPTGDVTLTVSRLGDFSALLRQPVAGSLQAAVHAKVGRGGQVATVDVKLRGLTVAHTRIASAGITAEIRNPVGTPDVNGTVTASGVVAGKTSSGIKLTVAGRPAALALGLRTTTDGLPGPALVTNAAATLDLTRRLMQLTRFDTEWQGETVHLDAPAELGWGAGFAVDRLQLSVGAGGKPATLSVAGRVTPGLALQVTVRNVTPALVKPFAPGLDLAGVVQADATLGGTLAKPNGQVRVSGSGLRDLSGPARALAPANLVMTADVAGNSAMIDGNLAEAGNLVTLTGDASPAALDLVTHGRVDLAVLDPILLAQGRSVKGLAVLDATIRGTPDAPAVAGTASLRDGELQDYPLGVDVTGIVARLNADGRTLRVDEFSAKAGNGTITASGTVGLAAPYPIAIELVNHNAQVFTSDRISAAIDGSLALEGSVDGGPSATGNLLIDRAALRLPERMPVSVASITVIRPGGAQPRVALPPVPPPLPMTLAVHVRTRDVVFVRGRGVYAELTGDLHVAGDLDKPYITGAFDLRDGSYTVVGTTLDFSRGTVSFDGGHGYDPALNFVASNTSNNITATLTVGGYASKPTITLSSVPELPQDEIMSELLFSTSVAQLSPFQIAEIGSALASLGGLNVGLDDPLETARKAIGLDQLTVGSGDANTGPTLEGGRYVARGVFIGAKQSASSSDTTAEVRIDLTKQLKLETDVGNSKDGSDVGLSYQFEY